MSREQLAWVPIVAAGLLGLVAVALVAWRFRTGGAEIPKSAPVETSFSQTSQEDEPTVPVDEFQDLREKMVARQLAARGIADQRVLAAMRRVPRHRYVSRGFLDQAYEDHPLPIGHRQTISQPWIVARMTELAQPDPGDRALDVGTGSGYQAAVLGELVADVFSIEILEPLAESARQRLDESGYTNVQVRCGDGYRGWPEEAPFDVIIVAAAPDHIPQSLIDQLAPGGRLVIPVGDFFQELWLLEKDQSGNVSRRKITSVAFVPMTGEAETK